jgi:hypothetical protein
MHLAINELLTFIDSNLDKIHPRNLVVTLNLVPNLRKGIYFSSHIKGGQERIEKKLAEVCA